MVSKSEKTRRKLNIYSDNKPSHKHHFNYKIAKRFVHKKRVLDVGCWSGQFEELAIGDVEAITGIDPSRVAIKYAKERITEGSFYVGSVEKLPFDNKSFDTVTLFDVLEHVPVGTEIKSLQEICRVLDDKGYLIISTPNKHILSIMLDPAYFLIGHRHYSQKELTNMLKKTGFRIKKTFKVGGFFDLSSHVFEMILKHIFKTSFTHPKMLKKKINGEYKKGGIASLYIIARKD